MESNYEVFLKTDLSMYIGKWIAIVEGKIVVSGDSAKEVMNHALLLNKNKKVTLAKVPEEETMIY